MQTSLMQLASKNAFKMLNRRCVDKSSAKGSAYENLLITSRGIAMPDIPQRFLKLSKLAIAMCNVKNSREINKYLFKLKKVTFHAAEGG